MKKDKNKNNNKKDWFKYVVIVGVLLIPFMYGFFYLKSYWNPYNHLEDLPVAFVNEDKTVDGTNKGTELIKELKKKNTLDMKVVSKDKAKKGLNNKDYYAVITIPSDFTSNLLSASEEEKASATITYSPNQKTNYLSSQIISRVMLEVEEEVRSSANKEIAFTLSDKLKDASTSVEKLSDGLGKIKQGTEKVNDGAKTLNDGTSKLASSYVEFDNGVESVNNGANDLYNGLEQLQSGVNTFASKASKLNDLSTGAALLKDGHNEFTTGLNTYVNSVNQLLVKAKSNSNSNILTYPILTLKTYTCTQGSPMYDSESCTYFTAIVENYKVTDPSYTLVDLISDSGNKLVAGNTSINTNINKLSAGTSSLSEVQSGVKTLKNGTDKLVSGANTLKNGTGKLSSSSKEVLSGINTVSTGTTTLYNGTSTLNSGVKSAQQQVVEKLSASKNELKKLDGLDTFAAKPVSIKEKDVNKVTDYGTAFAPLFISIALWVGSLMLFIILFYDVKDRFPSFSRNQENKLKRTFSYLGLASLQGIVFGALLLIGLDFNITNYFLYFATIILIACTFESIMEFLIINFGDIGKFFGLIILVLQLAAAGGTFPIQTVSKGFQKLFNFLPMKYTIDLIKESLISIESSLLSKSLFVVLGIFIVFFALNIIKDLVSKNKKAD